jgi:hypothetical protein
VATAGNRWEVYTVLGDIEDDDDHEHAAELTAAACLHARRG